MEKTKGDGNLWAFWEAKNLSRNLPYVRLRVLVFFFKSVGMFHYLDQGVSEPINS